MASQSDSARQTGRAVHGGGSTTAAASSRRSDSGWAPYWAPMLAFLLSVEVGRRVPESAEPVFLVLRALVPGGLVAWYALRGAYPELRGLRPDGRIALDVLVGLLGAALWIGPFLWFPSLRPDAEGFDPTLMGEGAVALTLALRFVGYALVTPFVEELFVRSWLIRYIDVFDRRRDFRKVPIGRFSWRSFIVVTVYFVFTHLPWEWGVMFAWTMLTMAWFYHRKHLMPLVIAHAVTNGSILVFAALFDGRFVDEAGRPLSLWFFI